MFIGHIRDFKDEEISNSVLSRLKTLYDEFDEHVLFLKPNVFVDFIQNNNMAVKIMQELSKCEVSKDYITCARRIRTLLSGNSITSDKLFPLIKEINKHLGAKKSLMFRLGVGYDIGAHHDVLHFVSTAEEIRQAIKELYQQVYSPVHLRYRMENNISLDDVYIVVMSDYEGDVVRGYVDDDRIFIRASSGLGLLHHGNEAYDEYCVENEFLSIVHKDITEQKDRVVFGDDGLELEDFSISDQKISDHYIMECARIIKKLSLLHKDFCEYVICTGEKGCNVVDILVRNGVSKKKVDNFIAKEEVKEEVESVIEKPKSDGFILGGAVTEIKEEFVAQFRPKSQVLIKTDMLLETVFSEVSGVLKRILVEKYSSVFNKPASNAMFEVVSELRTMVDIPYFDKLQVVMEMLKTDKHDANTLLRGIGYCYQIIESFENA